MHIKFLNDIMSRYWDLRIYTHRHNHYSAEIQHLITYSSQDARMVIIIITIFFFLPALWFDTIDLKIKQNRKYPGCLCMQI